jgi:hypothetical protein
MHQIDMISAFTNSELDEEVYMRFPPGFPMPGKAIRLKTALYGLRRSPLLWLRLLSNVLVAMGLKAVPDEPCIFMDEWIIVFFYVDDLVYVYRSDDEARANAFRTRLAHQFKLRDLGELRWFLGIHVLRDNAKKKIWMVQDEYMKHAAMRFRLDQGNGCPSTPLTARGLTPNESTAVAAVTHAYQSKVGTINFPAQQTRPDLAFATALLARYMTNPSDEHVAEANRLIQYAAGTAKRGISFDGNWEGPELEVFCDASFADDQSDRRSSWGYVVRLFGGAIAWKAGKQPTVTTSSTEAELLALSHTITETIALKRLFRALTFELNEDIVIKCDNMQTIRLVTSAMPRIRTALRHVDIHNAWARQEVQKGTVKVEYVPTKANLADGFTKNLSRNEFARFVNAIGLVDVPDATDDDDALIDNDGLDDDDDDKTTP